MYSDSIDVGGRRSVSVGVSSKPLVTGRSAGSGDASASSVRTTDDNSIIGGMLWYYQPILLGRQNWWFVIQKLAIFVVQ